MDDDLYLVTHDVKNSATRIDTALAMISVSAGKVQNYRALTVLWPKGIGSNDLESLCVVPGSLDTSEAPARMEILAAESGYAVVQSGESSVTYGGRIFHLTVVFDSSNFEASVTFRRAYPLPILHGRNIIGGTSGDNFEGMTCVTNDSEELLVVLGERGGAQNEGTPQESSRRGSLYYTVFDLDAGTMGQWEYAYDGAGSEAVHAPDTGWLDTEKKRDIAALFTCGDTIWAAATEEQNAADRDEPPFRSVVYPVAKLDRTIRFDPPASRPITLLERPPARWVSLNKIEGISGKDTVGAAGCELVTVSDDENQGGGFFEIP